ncbi:MAG TPA: ACT domain-containing protein [Mycobacteriales bacterium]|nr:ACT domain-containing protein [Mycobacteriales bacterium]
MGIQLRVSIPDQPGALARVAQAIARAGADVISVSVLESEAGRVIDDFRLRWPDGKNSKPLTDAVRSVMGVELVGCRRTRWLLDGRPDLDLLTYLIAVPERGLETLVDMAPAALDADWAELRPPARRLPALYLTSATPHDELAPESMPIRAAAWEDPSGAWAYFPLAALHSVLVIGRDGGPTFLRSEISHAERVLDLAMKTLERVLRASGAPNAASELTAYLGHAEPA